MTSCAPLSPQIGIDGLVPVGVIAPDGCCPIDLCQIDLCGLACNLVHSLPSGDLWDKPKRRAIATMACGRMPCADKDCTSIVQYAVMAGRLLHHRLKDILWPALREADPFTAHDTLDRWLDRLGWQDCFRCACDCRDARAGEERPPYELLMPDGTTLCCPSEAPAGLDLAVKRGIVIALYRARLGIVPNLAAINFVLSSLRAEVRPAPPGCDDCPDHCLEPRLVIVPTSDTIPEACRLACPTPACTRPDCAPVYRASDPAGCREITAYWTLTCNGAGDGRRIYPGVLAAECIARTLLSPSPAILLRA